jgi:hypothetical protein
MTASGGSVGYAAVPLHNDVIALSFFGKIPVLSRKFQNVLECSTMEHHRT